MNTTIHGLTPFPPVQNTAKSRNKSFLLAVVRVYSLAKNPTQKQFSLTAVSLNKANSCYQLLPLFALLLALPLAVQAQPVWLVKYAIPTGVLPPKTCIIEQTTDLGGSWGTAPWPVIIDGVTEEAQLPVVTSGNLFFRVKTTSPYDIASSFLKLNVNLDDLETAYRPDQWKPATLEILNRICPDAKWVADSAGDGFFVWFQDTSSFQSIILTLATAVHESVHMVTMNGYPTSRNAYLPGPSMSFFPRSEIKALLPLPLQEIQFYYLYLDGQDFVTLLNELNAYTWSTLIDSGSAHYFPPNMLKSTRDGLLAMMLFTELYLKVCRENHYDKYAAIDNKLADAVTLLWNRAETALRIAEQYPQLGVGDASVYSYVAQYRSEIEAMANKVAPRMTISRGIPIDRPLTITRDPISQNVAADSTVVLTVEHIGPKLVTYQWLFNDTTLTGATNRQLTIPNVAAVNSGSYKVVISCPQGSVTSAEAVLSLAVPPIITQQPRPQTTVPATFSVVVEGSPPLSYQWYWNGWQIVGATGPTLTNQFNPGTYQVKVSNPAGAVLSDPATLIWP